VTNEGFGAVLKRLAARRPDDIAVRYGENQVTWEEFDRRTDARAGQLVSSGVAQDGRVAIALPNGVGHHEWVFATWKAGATPCIIPHRLPANELSEIIALATPAAIIGTEARQSGDAVFIAGDSPLPVRQATPPRQPASSWKIVASGGSTGRPKLIVDRGPAELTAGLEGIIDLLGIPRDGTVLNAGPLYHNGPFLFSNLALIAGSRVVGMNRFDPEEWLKLVERERVEWCFLVPTMMHRIWSLPAEVRLAYDISSLKRIVHMAAACPVWLKSAWIDWLGPDRVFEGYAGTETPGTTISGAEWLKKPGSVGRVAPDTITVRGPDGLECQPGEIGEIFFPPTSADRFHYIGSAPTLDASGRVSLGDMGYIDPDGYLYLADRRTDMIIRGGANIYPAEIEAAFDEHPAVAGAAAIGLPCEEFGHRVHVILQVRAGNEVPIKNVIAFAADRLAAYKRPETYEIIDGPLRDDAGKIRRSALRDERIEWLRTGKPFQQAIER